MLEFTFLGFPGHFDAKYLPFEVKTVELVSIEKKFSVKYKFIKCKEITWENSVKANFRAVQLDLKS